MRKGALFVFAMGTAASAVVWAGKVPEAMKAADPERRLSAMVGKGGGLTAEEVAARAQQTSWDMAARRASIEAAIQDREAAKVSWAPRLKLSMTRTQMSGADPVELGPMSITPNTSQTELGAQISVPVTDYLYKIPRLTSAAAIQVDAARFNAAGTQREVDATARVAYYEFARARLSVVVAEQALGQARSHLHDAQVGLDVGTASRADVFQVEAQVASSELTVEQARNGEAVATRRLRTTMHDDSGKPGYEIGEDLLVDLGPLPGAPGVEALVSEAMTSRPELMAMERGERAQTKQAEAQLSALWPSTAVTGGFVEQDPSSRALGREGFEHTWQIGVSMSYTPNDGLTGLHQSSAGKARVAESRARRRAREDSIRGDVERAWYDELQARAAIRSTTRSLEAATEAHRVRHELFVNGRATSGELTDAETELTKARFAAIDARMDHRVARVKLLHAIGRAQ